MKLMIWSKVKLRELNIMASSNKIASSIYSQSSSSLQVSAYIEEERISLSSIWFYTCIIASV